MLILLNKVMLIATRLSSSNIPFMQLTRMGSGLTVLAYLCLHTYTGEGIESLLAGAEYHVSILENIMELSVPALMIPNHLTVHTSLHVRKNVDKLRYKYDHMAIIYGIVCNITQMIYIGSSWDPVRRFNKHFIKKDPSRMNPYLLADIDKYGLENFTVYVFTKVVINRNDTLKVRKATLRKVEQSYMDMYPTELMYNSIKAES